MRVACLLFLSAWWIPAGAGADGGPSLTVRAPHKWLFGLGSTVQLSAQVLDGAGSPVEGASIDWSSSDTAIATVDATGSVMATGFGTVTIRAVWGEAAGEQRLRVTPDVPWEIEPGRDIVFRNVTVVPMDEERVLSNQTVVVRDGRIVSMGPAESIDAPEQAESIDAEGLYLMPGLADMHSHFLHGNPHWQNDLFLYLANGVTAVREMWGSTEFLRWRDLASSSGVPAPTLYISSPGMDGPESRFAPGTPPVTTAEQARWTVATYKWQGFDFIKVYTDLRPEVYQAILEEAARQGLRVVGHAPSRVPFETVVASGRHPSNTFRVCGRRWSPVPFTRESPTKASWRACCRKWQNPACGWCRPCTSRPATPSA